MKILVWQLSFKNKSNEYIGGISGTNYPKSTSKLQDWCRPVATFDMPVYLITVSEVEFFKAEYYARYGSAADAATHYAAAIEASFASANVKWSCRLCSPLSVRCFQL